MTAADDGIGQGCITSILRVFGAPFAVRRKLYQRQCLQLGECNSSRPEQPSRADQHRVPNSQRSRIPSAMLSRLSSAASILRPTPPSPSAASDSESSTSRARSLSLASSALADAIDTPIAGDSKSIPTALAAANHELVSSLEALQGAQREQLHTRLELLARIQCILTVQVGLFIALPSAPR